MNEFLLTASTILGLLGIALHFVHMFKLDGIAAGKLDQVADAAVARAKATPDPGDDGMAEAEASVLHSIAAMIRDGKVEQGVAALQAFAQHRAASSAAK